MAQNETKKKKHGNRGGGDGGGVTCDQYHYHYHQTAPRRQDGPGSLLVLEVFSLLLPAPGTGEHHDPFV